MNYKITCCNEPEYIIKNRIFLKINVLPELFRRKGNKIIFLQEELEKYLSNNLQFINIDKLLNINSNTFKDLYNTYKISYKDLTKELFLSMLKIVIKIFLGQKSSELSVIEKITKERKQEITKFFDTITPFVKFKYSILLGSFYCKILEPIDLEEIFKTINLDKTFRIVYKGNEEPVVKLYLENEDETKEFLSSKIFDGKFVNRNKGLVFKVYQDNHSFNIFLTSTKISIKYNFVYEDNINFSDIEKYNKILYLLLKKIRNVKYTNINTEFTNIQVNIDKNIEIQKLITKIDKYKKFLKFEQTIEKRKKFFKIIYTDIFTKEKYYILIKNGEKIVGNYINKILVLSILGVKDEYTLKVILTILTKLFDEVKENTDYKKVANVKQIKQQGILIDTVSCQKNRQPKLVSKKGSDNLQDYSYINYKNNLFVCNKNPYIYPGFTSKDTLCCFKKDQTNKPAYIRNVSTKKNLDEDKDILSKVVKKDKILEPNRLGYINLFEKRLNFFRLGNKKDNKSFLNCINSSKISDKHIDIQDLINSKVYKVLFKNKKYLSNDYSHEQLYDLIRYYLKINLLIIDITSSLKPVFICKSSIKEYKNYIVVIKNEKHYELLVQKVKGNKLKRVFDINDTILLEKLHESCHILKEGITNNFPMSLEEFDSKIVKIQILDKFNKVIFIYTDIYGLIPIYPSQINPLLPYTTLNDEGKNLDKFLLEANKQYKLLKNSKISYLSPISQIISSEGKTIGILTSSLLTIPTKSESKMIKNLSEEKWMKYPLIKYNVSKIDLRKKYINKMKYYTELYERIRYLLSKILPKMNKEITPKFLYNLLIPYTYRKLDENFDYSIELPIIRNLCDNSTKNCSKDPFCINYLQKCYLNIFVSKDTYMNMLSKISNEINKYGKLINIRKELYNKDNFIKRPNEIILSGINDIINFVKN